MFLGSTGISTLNKTVDSFSYFEYPALVTDGETVRRQNHRS